MAARWRLRSSDPALADAQAELTGESPLAQAYLTSSPVIARPTITGWIPDVPSKIIYSHIYVS